MRGGDAEVRAHGHDVRETGLRSPTTQARDRDQPLDLDRRLAVPVAQLIDDEVDRVVLRGSGCRGRQLLVRLEAQPLAVDVRLGQARVDGQLQTQLGGTLGVLAAEGRHGLADHAEVQVEPDTGDMTGLLGAEQITGAAELEVLQGDLHAAAEIVVHRDRLETVGGCLGQRLHLVVQEVRVGAVAPATHASAQLVQL